MARLPRSSAVSIARPVALSNSDSFSARNARPTVSPTRTCDVGGDARLHRAVLGVDRDDLRGAEIFGAEHRAAQRARVVEPHMLRPDAERQLALGAGPRASPARRSSASPMRTVAARRASSRRAKRQEIHRRRADEVGDEHAWPAGRRSRAACRTARRRRGSSRRSCRPSTSLRAGRA